MQRDAGVPDGREAGLNADSVAFADEEVAEVLLGFEHFGMVVGVAQGAEDDEHVDHRREDGAQALGPVHVLQDPFFGFPDGLGAEGGDGGFFVALEGHVERAGTSRARCGGGI